MTQGLGCSYEIQVLVSAENSVGGKIDWSELPFPDGKMNTLSLAEAQLFFQAAQELYRHIRLVAITTTVVEDTTVTPSIMAVKVKALKKGRNQGRTALSFDEPKRCRNIGLTNTATNWLSNIAESHQTNRNDVIELWRGECYPSQTFH